MRPKTCQFCRQKYKPTRQMQPCCDSFECKATFMTAHIEKQRRARAKAERATRLADRFDQALTTGRSALFIGRPGTGKTHLAAGIGLRIMHRDSRTVLFTTVMRAGRQVIDGPVEVAIWLFVTPPASWSQKK